MNQTAFSFPTDVARIQRAFRARGCEAAIETGADAWDRYAASKNAGFVMKPGSEIAVATIVKSLN